VLEAETNTWLGPASTGRDMADTPPHPDLYKSIAAPLIAYSAVCQIVILIVVSLRFYIRLRLLRKFGVDDMALAATLTSTIGSMIGIAYGT
jgi:hypothetical protein